MSDRPVIGRRLGAAGLDWLLVLVLPLGVVTIAMAPLVDWQWLPLLWVVAYGSMALGLVTYFALGLSQGGTLGMRVCGLAVRDAATGATPGRAKAVGRAAWSLAAAVALLLVSAPVPLAGIVGVAIALLTAGGHALALLRDRSLQDRLFGFVVVPGGRSQQCAEARPSSRRLRRAAIAATAAVYLAFAFWLEACVRVDPVPAADHLGSEAWVAGPGLLVVFLLASAWPGILVGAVAARRRAGRPARWLLGSCSPSPSRSPRPSSSDTSSSASAGSTRSREGRQRRRVKT